MPIFEINTSLNLKSQYEMYWLTSTLHRIRYLLFSAETKRDQSHVTNHIPYNLPIMSKKSSSRCRNIATVSHRKITLSDATEYIPYTTYAVIGS
jgi:hypothetical protein